MVQGGGHMRAVSSTGALPRSAGNSPGGRVVAAARREGRSPALVVEDIPSGALSPQVESGPSFVPGHRPSTSGSVVHRSTTVARLPVPGSRGSSRSQAATRPATPFTLLDDMHVSMDGLNLSAVGGSPGGGALEGGSSLLGTSDPLLQTSGISASVALPSISGSGVSPYDENQRLRRELALMRKRYRQLDFELKKELQVPTSPPPLRAFCAFAQEPSVELPTRRAPQPPPPTLAPSCSRHSPPPSFIIVSVSLCALSCLF